MENQPYKDEKRDEGTNNEGNIWLFITRRGWGSFEPELSSWPFTGPRSPPGASCASGRARLL